MAEPIDIRITDVIIAEFPRRNETHVLLSDGERVYRLTNVVKISSTSETREIPRATIEVLMMRRGGQKVRP